MKRCLMMMLLIVFLMPAIYATPTESPTEPSRQELLSAIDPSLYYPGSVVREFVKKMFQEVDRAAIAAYHQGKVDGAAQAAVPLLIEIQGLRAWKEGAKDKLMGKFLKTVLFVVGGIAVGFIAGTIIQ